MHHVTIIATSLNEDSKSRRLAGLFEEHLRELGVGCEQLDLRDLELPFAGPAESWAAPDVAVLREAVERASHVVFAVPVYCYGVNSAAKNVIELVGRSFARKVVGFICSAGGAGSFMAVMGFANQLMLDFRSVIVPRFFYVDDSGWEEDGSLKEEFRRRLAGLAGDLREVRVVAADG